MKNEKAVATSSTHTPNVNGNTQSIASPATTIAGSRLSGITNMIFPTKTLLFPTELHHKSKSGIFRKPSTTIIPYRSITKVVNNKQINYLLIDGDHEAVITGLNSQKRETILQSIAANGGNLGGPYSVIKTSRFSSVGNLFNPDRLAMDNEEVIQNKDNSVNRVRFDAINKYISDGKIFKSVIIGGEDEALDIHGFSHISANVLKTKIMELATRLTEEGRIVRVSRFSSILNFLSPEKLIFTSRDILYVKKRLFVKNEVIGLTYPQITHFISSGIYAKSLQIGYNDGAIHPNGWFSPRKMNAVRHEIKTHGGKLELAGKTYRASRFLPITRFFSPERVILAGDMFMHIRKVPFKKIDIHVAEYSSVDKIKSHGYFFKRFEIQGTEVNGRGYWFFTYWLMKRAIKKHKRGTA